MSNNLQSYCFVNNSTNKCDDKNYAVIYDNNGNDVYKVNYFSSPSSMNLYPGPNTSQPTNIGSNNNTQPYAHVGHVGR